MLNSEEFHSQSISSHMLNSEEFHEPFVKALSTFEEKFTLEVSVRPRRRLAYYFAHICLCDLNTFEKYLSKLIQFKEKVGYFPDSMEDLTTLFAKDLKLSVYHVSGLMK